MYVSGDNPQYAIEQSRLSMAMNYFSHSKLYMVNLNVIGYYNRINFAVVFLADLNVAFI